MKSYEDFLRAKVQAAPQLGFEVSAEEINPLCKPHQRDIILWKARCRCAPFCLTVAGWALNSQWDIGKTPLPILKPLTLPPRLPRFLISPRWRMRDAK